jgi:FAD:protein FMN transferase
MKCRLPFLLWVLFFWSATFANAGELVSLAGETMGTTYSVKFSELPEGLTVAALQAEVDGCLKTVNNQMSTWQSDSELSRFNRLEEAEWFPVSAETAHVVKTAIEISEMTGGAFDVTVGPLVNLWNFGPDRTDHRAPGDSQIAETKARVGYQHLEVRETPPALRKALPDVYVDLSAIAKGFGVDQVAEVLDRHSIANFMVEIGGEVRTKGMKPDGKAWRIGIERPTPFSRSLQNALPLSGESLATSGDYRNFMVIDGKRYSHAIDPRTGRPVDHQLTSASVIAENCMLADAYATSLMVLGPDEGYNWATQHNIAALLIVRDGDRFLEKPTPAFAQLFPAREDSSMNLTTTWLIAAGVFLLAVLLMAVGVIFSNRSIKGSCGGLAGMRDEQGKTLCDACSNPAPECQGPEDAKSRTAGAADSERS